MCVRSRRNDISSSRGDDHPAGGLHWTEFEPAGENFDKCPFKVGDRIVYKPSESGWKLEFLGHALSPGKTYVVREIQGGRYVLVEGDPHPCGGLSWTEFEPAA